MISFIIPTYNDYKNLRDIIVAISNCKYKHEILVINDGSQKEISKRLRTIIKSFNNPSIKLIVHKTNKGKSQAMKTGLLNSKGEIVAYIDADLKGLTSENVCKLVSPVVNDDFDITMSQKESGLSKFGTYGYQQNFTGERCFKKDILINNLDIFDVAGNYAIESEMNRRFYNEYKIAIVKWTNVSNPAKIRHGIKDGLKQDLKMNKEILRYLSKKELLSQLKTVRTFHVIE